MKGFDASWLALREVADVAARSKTTVTVLAPRLREQSPVRILDLATGTGSNPRYLAPLLGGEQEWLLTDGDPGVLAALPGAMAKWAQLHGYAMSETSVSIAVSGPGFSGRFRLLRLDLAEALNRLPIQGHGLVTASALLDLVSASWLGALVGRCRAARAGLLFALTYDGRIRLAPRHPGDGLAARLVNRHQRTDKGFGPALGPGATDAAQVMLARLGYRVARLPSDWSIAPEQRELQQHLLGGWASAAMETAPGATHEVGAWLWHRRRYLARGLSRMLVGHQDLIGL
jgi:hypothetical protein